MLADLGFASLLLAFITSLYAIGASWYGARQQASAWIASARNAVRVILPLVVLACVILVVSLLRNDFSIAYVSRVTSIDTPAYLKVTALWGGQQGSLLFWNLLVAIFTAAAMQRKWREERELMPYAILIASITQAFFLFITNFLENPFARLASVPADGQGLNPLLRHPGMIIHPPMLYLGFIGFTIPYTFAMSALITGKLDDGWIRTTRRWTLVAWLFLSGGLILGGRWAYDVLGWGGYWGWDAVENAALMPWLSGTAFLHSVMIQEKRGMFRWWNMFLIIITYWLIILGALHVRGGTLSSVHAFAQSAVGPVFLTYLAGVIIFSLYWLNKRQRELSSRNRLESYFSREAAFLLNNFIILAILGVVFLGTHFEILSELIIGEKMTVGAPYYERWTGPLFGLLVILMGIAPLTMWYRSSLKKIGRAIIGPTVTSSVLVVVLLISGLTSWVGLLGIWIAAFAGQLTLLEYWHGIRARMRSKQENALAALRHLVVRNRRRYGGYCIHLGVIVMAFGVVGIEVFQQETQVWLQAGQSVSLGKYTAIFNGVQQFPGRDDLIVTEATLDLYKDGRLIKTLTPHNELYQRSGQPMTIPDLRSSIADDFYVILVNWEGITSNSATFRVFLNPLVSWVWAGGIIFILGTLVAAWPDPVDEKLTSALKAQRRIAVAAD